MLKDIKRIVNNLEDLHCEYDYLFALKTIRDMVNENENWEVFEKLEALSKNLEVKKMVYELLRLTDGGDFFFMNMNLSMLIDDKEEKMIDKVEYMMMIYFSMYKSLKNGDLKI